MPAALPSIPAAATAAATAAAAAMGLTVAGGTDVAASLGGVLGAQTQTQNLMALTRKARRLHVGNLPQGVGLTIEMLKQFFSAAITSAKLHDAALEGDPVVDAMIGSEGKYGFVEFRSVAEATSCLALNNIELAGKPLRIERPRDYAPMPESMRDELRKAGVLGSTSLSPDGRDTLTPVATMASQALPFPTSLATPAGLVNTAILPQQAAPPSRPAPPPLDASNATAVVALTNMMTQEEAASESEVGEILEDTRAEAEKHGTVLSLAAPKPGAAGEPGSALDAAALSLKVFVHFESAASATACAQELHGKAFDGRAVVASFVSVDTFQAVLALPCHVG